MDHVHFGAVFSDLCSAIVTASHQPCMSYGVCQLIVLYWFKLRMIIN